MTTPSNITPEAAQLRQIIADAERLVGLIEKGASELGSHMQWARFHFLKSIYDYSQGDIEAEFDAQCHEMGVDMDGDPVDENGTPRRTYNPSRVHPDSPTQSDGWA